MQKYWSFSRRLAVAVFAVAACTPAACTTESNKMEIRYRVTVVADEHGVERRGSAVWSLSLARPLLPLADPYNTDFRGDAIPIVMQNGGILFILLQSWIPERPRQALENPNIDVGRVPSLLFRDYLSYKGGDEIKILEELKYSKLHIGRLICPKTGVLKYQAVHGRIPTAAVCFRMAYSSEPLEKSTLREIDPGCVYFDGRCGIRIKRVALEVTDDPVDRPLNNAIPWINQYSTKRVFDELAYSKPGFSQTLFVLRR